MGILEREAEVLRQGECQDIPGQVTQEQEEDTPASQELQVIQAVLLHQDKATPASKVIPVPEPLLVGKVVTLVLELLPLGKVVTLVVELPLLDRVDILVVVLKAIPEPDLKEDTIQDRDMEEARVPDQELHQDKDTEAEVLLQDKLTHKLPSGSTRSTRTEVDKLTARSFRGPWSTGTGATSLRRLAG